MVQKKNVVLANQLVKLVIFGQIFAMIVIVLPIEHLMLALMSVIAKQDIFKLMVFVLIVREHSNIVIHVIFQDVIHVMKVFH